MGFWLRLLAIVAALVVLSYLLSAVIGLLFWFGIAIVLIGAVTAVVRHLVGDREIARAPGRREELKLAKTVDRALKDLEQKSGKR